jgi:hypothetical protein
MPDWPAKNNDTSFWKKPLDEHGGRCGRAFAVPDQERWSVGLRAGIGSVLRVGFVDWARIWFADAGINSASNRRFGALQTVACDIAVGARSICERLLDFASVHEAVTDKVPKAIRHGI